MNLCWRAADLKKKMMAQKVFIYSAENQKGGGVLLHNWMVSMCIFATNKRSECLFGMIWARSPGGYDAWTSVGQINERRLWVVERIERPTKKHKGTVTRAFSSCPY